MFLRKKEQKDRTALFMAVAEYLLQHYEDTAKTLSLEETTMAESADKTCPADTFSMPCAPYKAMAIGLSLDELLENTDAGFSETLLKLIDERGKRDAEVYRKISISRQHFSKIRNNPQYRPTKATAVAFAIALELDLQQTQDFIGRAGYTLSNSSKFDVIVKYFIEKGHYDIADINITLMEFDQMLLCT